MDNIPFTGQRIIDELVGLWQTFNEPRHLAANINRLSDTSGDDIVASFFREVYEELCADKSSKYDYYTASGFKEFLEAEYSRLTQIHAERQAQAQAKELEELERRARTDFDALGKEIAKATTRAELVELGRKRANLAAYTGISYDYTNHCWNCKKGISSAIHARCPVCEFYICGSCGSCLCGFLNY